MAKKRGNGEGHIRQLKNGRWEARITIGYNEQGKQKFKTFRGATRKEAVQRLNDYIANRQGEEPQEYSKETLANWLKKWYDNYVVSSVKTSTRVNYNGHINRYLIPNLGHIKLQALKKTDIEAFYNHLLKTGRADGKGGLSLKTIENIARVLHKALQVALENGYVQRNVASLAKVPTSHSTGMVKKSVGILTKEEQQALLHICEADDVYCVGVYTIMYTGMRKGELLGLQWDDIDFEKRTIHICKQVNRLHDFSDGAKAKTKLGIQHDTKTKTSTRTISINLVLAERLQAHKAWQEEQSRTWGDSYHQLDMVFAREDGWYIDPSTFYSKYRKLLIKAGLEKHSLHALRHAFATRALEVNLPAKVVSNILGHANVQITLDTYSHVLPEYQSEAMDKIAEYIGT